MDQLVLQYRLGVTRCSGWSQKWSLSDRWNMSLSRDWHVKLEHDATAALHPVPYLADLVHTLMKTTGYLSSLVLQL